MRRTFAMFAVVLAGMVALAAPAAANVTANPNSGGAGSFFRTAFRVGHGCDGSPTTSVSIKIPIEQSLTSVHAEQIPGWTVEVVECGSRRCRPAKRASSGG